MYRFQAPRLTGSKRLAALLMLALSAACGDSATDSGPRPGPGTPPPDTTPVVASVEINPGTLQLPVDGTRALSATVRSRTGDVMQRLVEWTSSDPEVVRVDINGNVTALKVGTSTVSAAIGAVKGHSVIEVVGPPPVAHVLVSGETAGLEPGESRNLGVQLRAADGTVLQGRNVTWSSSDSTVIKAYADGRILGMQGGTATITATSEGKSGSVTIIIPEWLQFDLHALNQQVIPAVAEFTADTTDRTEHTMVVTEYRMKVTWGRVWLSTVDTRYRQRYEVQTWKRTVNYFQGSTITSPEEMIDSRTVSDEGRAEFYDVFTGEPIYESERFENHSFRVYRTEGRNRRIDQRIPGTTDQSFSMDFKK